MSEVPIGWYVVNPRRMDELLRAAVAIDRVEQVIDSWRDEPICGTTGAHEEMIREALGGER